MLYVCSQQCVTKQQSSSIHQCFMFVNSQQCVTKQQSSSIHQCFTSVHSNVLLNNRAVLSINALCLFTAFNPSMLYVCSQQCVTKQQSSSIYQCFMFVNSQQCVTKQQSNYICQCFMSVHSNVLLNNRAVLSINALCLFTAFNPSMLYVC